jgi:hypothetical protein
MTRGLCPEAAAFGSNWRDIGVALDSARPLVLACEHGRAELFVGSSEGAIALSLRAVGVESVEWLGVLAPAALWGSPLLESARSIVQSDRDARAFLSAAANLAPEDRAAKRVQACEAAARAWYFATFVDPGAARDGYLATLRAAAGAGR